MSNLALYSNPRGLFDFQATDVARGYMKTSGIVAWDTGTGKSHWAMAEAALLLEDGLIDLVLILAERNKIGEDEWVGDFRKFTGMRVHKYHGTGRAARLDKEPEFPQVIVTTYETAKADLVRFIKIQGHRSESIVPGPLVETIGNRRVLLVLDESTKVKNRSSNNYKAIYWFLNRHLRKAHKETRAWGLTATPLEKDWEDVFNQLRLLWPASMPTVKDFESRYVRYRNERGKPFYHEDRMHEFAAICQPYMLRRRKTDAELIDQFPKMIEDVRTIEMGDIQRRFYEMVEEIGFPEDAEEPEPGMHIVMRQIAGHPSSLLYSKGVFAQILVEELGADYIRSIPSAKTEALVEDLLPLVKGQGAKVLVFTFFGRSVLPLLAQALRAKKIQVWEHHGGMTGLQQETARREFKAFDGAGVLLSSDAGAKGINMAEATYVREYESALTFSQRTQRLNRIHRIDSTAVTTNATTYILEGTVEENLAVGMIERNEQTDTLFNDEADGGEHFITAEERRINLRIARSRKSTRRKKKVA